MTLAELNRICNDNQIADDVLLLSDSGWECYETQMNGAWYSNIDHAIVFVQDPDREKYEVDDLKWHKLSPNQKLRKLQ